MCCFSVSDKNKGSERMWLSARSTILVDIIIANEGR